MLENEKIVDFLFFLTAVEATFKFTYVEKYPDEPPLWEVHSQENLEDSDINDILSLLQHQVCLCRLTLYPGPSPVCDLNMTFLVCTCVNLCRCIWILTK